MSKINSWIMDMVEAGQYEYPEANEPNYDNEPIGTAISMSDSLDSINDIELPF